jgi:hypothetical protein
MEDRPRNPWVRNGSVVVRAAHLLAASVIAGAVVLGRGPVPHGWWAAAVASGVLLLGAEILLHRGLHRELAGWATIAKLVLIGAALAAPAAGPWLVSAAFVIAVLGAHAPKRWRHRRIF